MKLSDADRATLKAADKALRTMEPGTSLSTSILLLGARVPIHLALIRDEEACKKEYFAAKGWEWD